MQKFTTLKGVAAPLNMINVDTDMIIPKNYLKTIKRTGLGKNLFAEMRYDEQGREKPDFVLNKGPYRGATILVAGQNFGCGSSREHAPWALLDFGIRSVIAPSFADIFFNNTFKNGILPIVLPEARVNELLRFLLELPGAEISVDLPAQTVTGPDGKVDRFEIDAFRKHCLVNGLDEIGLTLEKAPAIAAYEARSAAQRPWA
jgi:3-isopropylmalate/(R)-2-methylmalate dehydratase small subunit